MRSLIAILCFTAAFISQIEKSFLRAEVSVNDRVLNLTARIGKNITLPCVFNKPTNCEWLRSNSTINFSVRGIKLSTKKTTANCSITLKKVNQKDFTSWTCCDMSKTNNGTDCMEIQLSQTIIPKPTINGRNETMTLQEHVRMNISCIAKNGNPPPSLYWKLGANRIDGTMEHISNGENNYTTILNWNTSLHCEDSGLTPLKLKCCAEDPSPDEDICVSIPLKQHSVSPMIMFNGRDVSHTQINLKIKVNSLENLTCVIFLSASCHDSNIPFELTWILDGTPIKGFTENDNNYEKVIAWNATLDLRQNFHKKQLDCRVTHLTNHNFSMSASVYLEWDGNIDAANSSIIIVAVLLPIIITVLIIIAMMYFTVKRKHKADCKLAIMQDEPIYANTCKEEFTMVVLRHPHSKEKDEVIYTELRLPESQISSGIRERNETIYAEIMNS